MVPMLPVTHGVEYTRWQILFYTVLLVLVTVLPWATGMSGLFYLGGALVLGAVFLCYAWRLLDPPDEFFAMRVFSYSIVYLMALFAFLLVDHWLLPCCSRPALQFEPVAEASKLRPSAVPRCNRPFVTAAGCDHVAAGPRRRFIGLRQGIACTTDRSQRAHARVCCSSPVRRRGGRWRRTGLTSGAGVARGLQQRARLALLAARQAAFGSSFA